MKLDATPSRGARRPIRAQQLAALATLALGSSLLGCSESHSTRTLRLTTHALASCPIDAALADELRVRFEALGDFPGLDVAPAGLELASPASLAIPETARALRAEARNEAFGFTGYLERGESDELPLLLWPEQRTCALGTHMSGAFALSARTLGAGVGYAPASHTLLVAGGLGDRPDASVSAFSFDSGTGEALAIAQPLREPRVFASVSAFGPSLLVAGGENPLRGSDDGTVVTPSRSAEIYDPATQRFSETRVELTVERTRHAALGLASGDTLLVGGRGPFGNALAVLERISAETGAASIAGLVSLRAPRLFPALLTLDDGRIFIGGGSAADGTPLSALEWLSGDARQHLGVAFPKQLPPRHDRAFAALPGGGVLAVGGCEARAAEGPEEDALCRALCNQGCPPARTSSEPSDSGYDAWWIGPEGELNPIDLPIAAPRPVLLGGSDGRPLLASGIDGDTTLYRFDPWQARFEALESAYEATPRAGLLHSALDDQAFAWLSDADAALGLYGLRVGTRNRFASDGPLLAAIEEGAAMRWPAALSPDRPLQSRLEDGALRVELSFDGALHFAAGSTVSVYLAGTSYLDFELSITAAGAALPRVIVGTREVGGEECAWPSEQARALRVRREGERLSVQADALERTCPGSAGRVRVGIRGAEDAASVRSLSITRSD